MVAGVGSPSTRLFHRLNTFLHPEPFSRRRGMGDAKRLPGIGDMRKRATSKMYGEIREDELMCRMLEAAHAMRRPEGISPAMALAAMDAESREWLRNMARAAVAYFAECLNASEKPS